MLLRFRVFPFLFLLISLLMTGCVTMTDPEASQEYIQDTVGILKGTQTIIGQTLISRRGRLNGIYLWLNKENPDKDSSFIIRLYSGTEKHSLLSTVTLPQSALADSGPSYIAFPPQSSQAGQAYYIQLEASGSSISVLGRNEDSYPQGTLYKNVADTPSPVSADLAFRLTYDYDLTALITDLSVAIHWLWLLFPFIVLFLPGWLLLDLTKIDRLLNTQGDTDKLTIPDVGERIALSVGLSLAIIPLALLWSTAAGIHWSRNIVLVTSLALVFLCLLSVGIKAYRLKNKNVSLKQVILSRTANLHTFSLVLIFILSLWARFAMIRDLSAPAWVDSIHHATITQLIVEKGQYPENYLPYMNVEAEEYHAGYHAGMATFEWLSRLDLATGMLYYGQVLNALTVFAVYLLAKFLSKDIRTGIVAALITGLITPMPAYYTSWGRYTQLTGLLILPVIVVLFQTYIERSQKNLQSTHSIILLLLTAISAGGLFIVHYRVAAFTAVLLIALLLSALLHWRTAGRTVKQTLGKAMLSGSLAFLLVLPWAWPTLHDVFVPIIAAGAQPSEFFGDFSWRYINAGMGIPASWLAGVGLIGGLLRRQRWIVAVVLWMLLLLLQANLGALGVPGAWMFTNNTAVAITLFMPISILGGYGVSQAYEAGKGIYPASTITAIHIILTILLTGLALMGAKRLLPILRPSTMLFRASDGLAMTWVNKNIPVNETILINPFLWGYSLYAGNDGGFWISPLAERQTLPQPILYGMGTIEEIQRINTVSKQVIENGKSATKLWEILQEQKIRYVYVGARGGPISPKTLHASPLFKTLYHQEDVWIFERKP